MNTECEVIVLSVSIVSVRSLDKQERAYEIHTGSNAAHTQHEREQKSRSAASCVDAESRER